MKIQSFLNGQSGIGLALTLGKILPPALGKSLARVLAPRIALRTDLPMVQAVYANQWVVRGGNQSLDELRKAVQAVYRNSAMGLYQFYHDLHKPKAILQQMEFSPEIEALIEQSKRKEQGVLAVAPHLGNFDYAGQALGYAGLDAQLLSYPNPNPGYQQQNQLRCVGKVQVTPISVTSMRDAIARLKSGGVVLTGLDRPLPGSQPQPRFFDRPAELPTGYLRLALKANVPMCVVATLRKPDGRYTLFASEFITLQRHPDPDVEIIENAERILAIAAAFIRKDPSQWAMYYPVWPQSLKEIPLWQK